MPIKIKPVYFSGEKKKIIISEVNQLAVEVCRKEYHARRDVILKWLKERGISVWGRR